MPSHCYTILKDYQIHFLLIKTCLEFERTQPQRSLFKKNIVICLQRRLIFRSKNGQLQAMTTYTRFIFFLSYISVDVPTPVQIPTMKFCWQYHNSKPVSSVILGSKLLMCALRLIYIMGATLLRHLKS